MGLGYGGVNITKNPAGTNYGVKNLIYGQQNKLMPLQI